LDRWGPGSACVAAGLRSTADRRPTVRKSLSQPPGLDPFTTKHLLEESIRPAEYNYLYVPIKYKII
jgi:hypothetical protein